MTQKTAKITIRKDGPYAIQGNLPLTRKSQVVSEHGEPMTWRKEGTLETEETYRLCRCGLSDRKPFCDNSHARQGFDGTEQADTRRTEERQITLRGSGEKLIVKRDVSLCMSSGFCGTRLTNINKMMPDADESMVRAQIMAMIERCPSGSFTYAVASDQEDIEPDLPAQVAVTTEITDEGPIMGPLWVTGNVTIERADGEFMETRNRVTLCRCGLSGEKPLCDGSHRAQPTRE
ncbi:MAG: CDGSH iron-sulfur domain-containing protein [Litorilinea sp.]